MRTRERGFAAVELSVGVALLMVPVAVLVLALPQWSSRQGVARLAARDAARAVGLSGWCDVVTGEAAVGRLGAGAGLPPGALQLSLDCAPSAPLPRGGTVTARVEVAMPVLDVPVIGTAAGWSWTAVHREPVDPYGSRP